MLSPKVAFNGRGLILILCLLKNLTALWRVLLWKGDRFISLSSRRLDPWYRRRIFSFRKCHIL